MITRGIRNNNPGNIRYDGTKWIGLDIPSTDGSFCRFLSAEFGIRALGKVIQTYYKKYGLNTVSKIINRFAPPNENDTKSYIKSVSNAISKNQDYVFELNNETLFILVRAIIKHENGCCPYSDNEINKGLKC